MKLYLIRHAQSESNVLKTLNTALPGPPLTELGREQAAALARRLAGEPVRAVYASMATRAQQTATPVAEVFGMRVQPVEGVHEINVGDLEDRADEDALKAFAKVMHAWTGGDLDVPLPGGETGTQVRDRYRKAVADLRAKHEAADADGVVVLVGHGGSIRLAAEWLCDNVLPELADSSLIPNTGIVQLESVEGGWHCLRWVDDPV
ncbi:histidine phosphatase family protein [Amycolatopsis sp. 195334CR]|uniref:histidine phosphatase family protein n=1 Tax=Amycolatopsis sp. 195334CR TaxID=2814588 RepID=UPI001A8F610F|nr:histidine phosphatase family protein [Amycolatopsis sp. 195334CR]MBN6035402.1 histidine phosphatase family protein [Amycolatopsis sp. 195334CR]